MILQELVKLYDRLQKSPHHEISDPGFSKENISFVVRLDSEGKFEGVEDWRTDNKPARIEVPKREGKRAGKVLKPYFLWDNTKYIFGRELKNGKEIETEENEKAYIQFNRDVVHNTGLKNQFVQAVLNFIDNPSEKSRVFNHEYWHEMRNSFITFKVSGQGDRLVVEHENVKTAWKKYQAFLDEEAEKQICLVSGDVGPVYPIHPTVKRGIGDKNDIPFMSFNISCAESYGKTQNFNAPVSREIAAKFTHALNYLNENSNHNLYIADTKTLFWAESNDRFADFFGRTLVGREDDLISGDLQSFLRSIRSGILPEEIKDSTRFFILGLAPNAARISVRFWYVDTVENIARNMGSHFAQLEIIRERQSYSEFPSLLRLLNELAVQHKRENIPPHITGPLMRSILSNNSYPNSILGILLHRMHRDQKYDKLNYFRATFIKAVLNRNYKKEIAMSLDNQRNSVAYLLGRLFAVLEKTQEESSGGNLNVTIKDRYFSSASTTPRIIFPRLLTLHQNHIKKLKSEKTGLAINREKLIGVIIDHLPPEIPPTLKLEDQGEFAIGYYQQRQDFFVKKEIVEQEVI